MRNIRDTKALEVKKQCCVNGSGPARAGICSILAWACMFLPHFIKLLSWEGKFIDISANILYRNCNLLFYRFVSQERIFVRKK
jgi:hypothetical protein